MGFIKNATSNVREAQANNVATMIGDQLVPQDGMIHIAMFNCFGSLGATQGFYPDTKFNQQADQVISYIQQLGREIVDVKFDSQYGVGMTGKGISYHMLVLYR